MKKEFVFWWKDYVTMPSSVTCIKALKNFSHLPGCATKDYMMLAENAELRFLISKEDIPNVVEQGDKYLDKKYFNQYMKDLEDAKRKYLQKVDEINSKDIKNLSNEELGKYLSEMIDLLAEGIAYYWGSQYEPLQKTEQRLRSILKKKYKGTELEEIFAILVTPIEFDSILKEELDFIDIVLNNKEFTRQLFKLQGRKYSWMFRNTFDMDVCFDFIKERFDRYKKEDIKKKAEDIIKTKKVLAIKQKRIINEFEADVSDLLNIFHKLSIIRMNLKFVFAGFEFLLYDLLSEISKRTNISFADMQKYVTPEEIVKLLNNEIEKISEEAIREREKFYAFIPKDGEMIFKYGAEELKNIKKQFPEFFEEKHKKELKGMVANPGKAKGRVVIVSTKDLESLQEINKRFNEGDIIVTAMTQPNTVLLMERAGAIVTDEGGLTSHAAIVSREFDIPCIVGTLEATEILKDGDLVEVDANNGVVRKLK